MDDLQRCLLLVLMTEISPTKPFKITRLNSSHKPGLRVAHGWNDTNEDYPFVVSILRQNNRAHIKELSHLELLRYCSGSLLSSRWVLTAAHCLSETQLGFVRCGDMTVPINETKCLSKILKEIQHPSFHMSSTLGKTLTVFKLMAAHNNIGLVNVEEIVLREYGILHGDDYKTLIGRPVRYAGYGHTNTSEPKTNKEIFSITLKLEMQPLQIGEGVIFTDEHDKLTFLVQRFCQPCLIIAPSCPNRKQNFACMSGDSGGPLFINHRIAGVLSQGYGNRKGPFSDSCFYTPVSPYLSWITANIKA